MNSTSKKAVRIGITSPLMTGEIPTPDMGVTQHCAMLERLGAVPIILHNDQDPREVIELFELDGLIFSGGEEDIAPERYGGNTKLTREADLRRDAFEFALMEYALQCDFPIFAVCRGTQVVNVVLKGTLIEDLRKHLGSAYRVMHDQVTEGSLPYQAYAHEIEISPNSLLHTITGAASIWVNSIHHQAIGTLAPELRIVAQAVDGTIEAIELSQPGSRFFLGVQWHPEWLSDDSISERLYGRLIQECGRPRITESKDGGFHDVQGRSSCYDDRAG